MLDQSGDLSQIGFTSPLPDHQLLCTSVDGWSIASADTGSQQCCLRGCHDRLRHPHRKAGSTHQFVSSTQSCAVVCLHDWPGPSVVCYPTVLRASTCTSAPAVGLGLKCVMPIGTGWQQALTYIGVVCVEGHIGWAWACDCRCKGHMHVAHACHRHLGKAVFAYGCTTMGTMGLHTQLVCALLLCGCALNGFKVCTDANISVCVSQGYGWVGSGDHLECYSCRRLKYNRTMQPPWYQPC